MHWSANQASNLLDPIRQQRIALEAIQVSRNQIQVTHRTTAPTGGCTIRGGPGERVELTSKLGGLTNAEAGAKLNERRTTTREDSKAECKCEASSLYMPNGPATINAAGSAVAIEKPGKNSY